MAEVFRSPSRSLPLTVEDILVALISQSTFVLKGTGWYVTDYARADSGAGKKPAKKKEQTSESTSSTTTTSSKDS